jgi:hypothetical protein
VHPMNHQEVTSSEIPPMSTAYMSVWLFVCSLFLMGQLSRYEIYIFWQAELHTRWRPLNKATIKGPWAPPLHLPRQVPNIKIACFNRPANLRLHKLTVVLSFRVEPRALHRLSTRTSRYSGVAGPLSSHQCLDHHLLNRT